MAAASSAVIRIVEAFMAMAKKAAPSGGSAPNTDEDWDVRAVMVGDRCGSASGHVFVRDAVYASETLHGGTESFWGNYAQVTARLGPGRCRASVEHASSYGHSERPLRELWNLPGTPPQHVPTL